MGLSEFFTKTFADQKSGLSQGFNPISVSSQKVEVIQTNKEAGQALLEYILVLIISVSIILGVLYQFNGAFKTFLDSYFGNYIACLLETGELPALGGDGPSSNECVMPDMDLAAGASLDSSTNRENGGGNSEDASSSPTDDGSEGSDSKDSAKGSGRPSRFTRSGAPLNAEATDRSAKSGRPAFIRKRASAQTKANETSKSGGLEASSSEAGFARRRSGRSIRNKRIIYLGEDYLTKDAKNKKTPPVLSKAKPAEKKEGLSSLRQPNFKLDLPERALTQQKDKKTSFSFGALIKFVLIGGILIAIFIFLGGQAVQIKKSWQKSE